MTPETPETTKPAACWRKEVEEVTEILKRLQVAMKRVDSASMEIRASDVEVSYYQGDAANETYGGHWVVQRVDSIEEAISFFKKAAEEGQEEEERS